MSNRIRSVRATAGLVTAGALTTLAALATLGGLVACQTRAYNANSKSTKGVPVGLTATYSRDSSRPGLTKFEIVGLDDKGQPASNVTRYAIGGAGFTPIQFIRDPDKPATPAAPSNGAGSSGSGNANDGTGGTVGTSGVAGVTSLTENRPAPGSEIGGLAGQEAAGKEIVPSEDNLYGTLLTQAQDENYGYITNTPWKCRDAEEFAYGEIRSGKPSEANQLCLVEIHTMGRPGSVSIVIIALDSKLNDDGTLDVRVVKEAIAKKLRMDPAWGAAKIAVSIGVKTRPIAKGHPERPNEGIDVDGVATAIYDAHHAFKSEVDDQTRNTCLRNYSSVITKWTDAAEHYWCQFPLYPLAGEGSDKQGARTCYITKLLELKAADDAAGLSITRPELPKLAAAIGLRQYHDAAYTHCVATGEKPFLWVDGNPQRKAAFKYIMGAVQLAQDFNLESEQKAVNEFYRRIAKPRARRVNDTYPEWLPEQPRYAEIIKFQALTRLGFGKILENPYKEWLKTNPTGPGVPGRFDAKPAATGTTPKAATPTRLDDTNPLSDDVNERLSK